MRRLFLLLGTLAVLGALAAPAFAQVPEKLNVFLYVDTVNGTRPVGAKPRPIGCTQTNVFQRGEQGFDAQPEAEKYRDELKTLFQNARTP